MAADLSRGLRDFLTEKIKADLPSRRWRHSLSVARLAERLGRCWGVNPERAFAAGLLHDAARALTLDGQRALLRGYRGRTWDPITRNRHSALWHAPAAALLARRRYGVRDTGILRAVALHTTGGPNMRTLDKIIFVADYAEPRRGFAAAAVLRRLAEKDLDAAVAVVVKGKHAYLRAQGSGVHPRSRALLASLAKRRR